MEDIKEEIKCEIRLLLHTKILKVAKKEDLENTASNILALIGKPDPSAKLACSDGLCCVPIREEIHCGLEAIYHQIGMEVKPGEQRDKLFTAANILNDFLRGKTT